jgi:hypothetical protein
MEHKYYGLCEKGVKRMAYSLAIRNGARHPFSRERERDSEAKIAQAVFQERP